MYLPSPHLSPDQYSLKDPANVVAVFLNSSVSRELPAEGGVHVAPTSGVDGCVPSAPQGLVLRAPEWSELSEVECSALSPFPFPLYVTRILQPVALACSGL